MLSDRRFTVDFKANEVPWIIGVLREAASVHSGSDFSKKVTIGSRSLKVSTVRNRTGVFIQLLCSCGGKNRRLIFILAGVKGRGWSSLANLLASVAVGGNTSLKSTSSSSSPCRPNPVINPRREAAVLSKVSFTDAVKGLASIKGKTTADSGWKAGCLPTLLKFGLNLSLGAPSTSGEASRRFAWKAIQSEIGAGTLVVELVSGADHYSQRHDDGQQGSGCSLNSTGGDALAINGDLAIFGAKEKNRSGHRKEDEDQSYLGKFLSPIQNHMLLAGTHVVPRTEMGTDVTSGVVLSPIPAVACDMYGNSNLLTVVKQSKQVGIGPGFGPEGFTIIPALPGLADKEVADPPFKSRLGCSSGGPNHVSGLGSILAKPRMLSHVFPMNVVVAPKLFVPGLRAAFPRICLSAGQRLPIITEEGLPPVDAASTNFRYEESPPSLDTSPGLVADLTLSPQGCIGKGLGLSSFTKNVSHTKSTVGSNCRGEDFPLDLDASPDLTSKRMQASGESSTPTVLVEIPNMQWLRDGSPPPAPIFLPYFPWLREGDNEHRCVARYNDITLPDAEGEDFMDSPNSSSEGVLEELEEERRSEIGQNVSGDFSSDTVYAQRALGFVDKLINMGVLHHEDREGYKALIIT